MKKIIGTPHNINDFWEWAYSDVLCNINRGILAEFLIASTLNLTKRRREEFDEVDLHYKGKKIEVKTSTFIQCWSQKKLSNIIYNISKKRKLKKNGINYTKTVKRWADIYVFCLYTAKKKTENILNTKLWEFYIIPTKVLNKKFKNQKSVSLNQIKKICEPIKYSKLKTNIKNEI